MLYGVLFRQSTNSAQRKGSAAMSFGKILRDLRGDKTQEEIAQAVGVTKSSWAMYEREERIPRDEVKIQIAKYFGKSVQDFFFRQVEH